VKTLIPADWDGEDWRCVEIRWPDSTLWTAVLHGLLSMPMRGRFWHEKSGQIHNAQATGREIWEANTPLIACGSTDGDVRTTGEIYGGGIVIEGEDMGQVVTDVTFENGKLYVWFGKCCKLLVTDLGDWQPEIGIAPVTDNPDEEENDYACRKAYAMGHKFHLLWEALDNCEDGQPGGWDTCVEDYVGLSLDGWRVGEYILAIKALDWVTDQVITAEITESERDMFICKMAAILDNSSTDLTEEEFEACAGALSEVWPTLFNPEFYLIRDSWYELFGFENAQKVSRGSYIYLDADCSCPPETPEPPGEFDWLHSYNFRYSDLFGWTLLTGDQVAGVGLKVNDLDQWDAGVNVWKASSASADATTYVQFIRIETSVWPTTETLAATCWIQFNDMGCDLSGDEKFGRDYIDWSGDELFDEAKRIRLKSFQATGADTEGDHVVWKLVVAGRGTDPWPSDP